MAKLVAKKLATMLLSLIVASLIVFFICQALPGDVARVILGDGATPQALAQVRHQFGLDQPWLLRYFHWITDMLGGSFGLSYFTHDAVSVLIAPRLVVTVSLVGFGMLGALLIAIPVGVLAARYRRSWLGVTLSSASQIGMAIPAFWAGILLVLVFAVTLRWLPANGYVPLSEDPARWASHLVLPVLSLALVQSAVLVRYVRSAVIDVLNQDYFRTARSIGWRPWAALWRHGVRNISVSLLTIIGLQFATLLVGAIVIESVFALPGLGTLLLDSVGRHDLAVVQGTVMFLVAAVLVINTLVDLAYLWIDPRVRGGNSD